MLTVDTITDEQIRGLRMAARHWDKVITILTCTVALGEDDESSAPDRAIARARCAEILNELEADDHSKCEHRCGLVGCDPEVNRERGTIPSVDDERSIACPTCEVAAGITCTSMNRTGYKALRKSHAARVLAWKAGR